MPSAAALAVKASSAAPRVVLTDLAAAEMVTVSIPPPMPTVPEDTAALMVRVSAPSKALTLIVLLAVPAAVMVSAPEVPTRVRLLEEFVLV